MHFRSTVVGMIKARLKFFIKVVVLFTLLVYLKLQVDLEGDWQATKNTL